VLPLTKRQREILDYLQDFIQQHGYAPSLEEIGRRFGLSSLATVHKHLTNLQEKGFIRRSWNRSRSVELLPSRGAGRAVEVPLLGYFAAGMPIEAVAGTESIAIPEALISGKRDTYVLRVRGDSMIEAHIADGDFVLIRPQSTARNGDIVVAQVEENAVTLKRFFKEKDKIRLQPANANYPPQFYDDVRIQGKLIGVIRRLD
jgi:repressor LexA